MGLRERLGESWYQLLKDEFDKDYFKDIAGVLKTERRRYNVFPPSDKVFRAYRLTPYHRAKVVIIGQDPYYNKGEADGLAFSVTDSLAQTPPSLENIFKEIERNFDKMNLEWSTDLTPWAEQGVFLLNRILTVREGQPLRHLDIGWQQFTNKTIDLLNKSPRPTVFMLWGNTAKQMSRRLDTDHHLVLPSSHPSPRSSYLGFNGCEHFRKCNEFLKENNQSPINWITTL